MKNGDGRCVPLSSLQELEDWSPHCTSLNIHPLEDHLFYEGKKTILCHDMKGGYLDDSHVNGCANAKAYRFFHWSLIDVFIYFSHSLVTIPPVTWINAAHKNGVPVLGTFITEGENGKVICETIFQSEDSCKKYANNLVMIAQVFKFEGWLINIENIISPENVPRVMSFLRYLTFQMKSICSKSLVIWYDSVTKEGELRWQNALNYLNYPFFESCDGIFLNYNWDQKHLQESLDLSKGRNLDVYVGVDVFGRGCCGGGGFNTIEAVEAIAPFNLSIAFFAPGWVHEVGGEENFETNEIKFWKSLRLPVRHVPKTLPFKTNFCQGFGHSLYKEGKSLTNAPWFNLSKCQPQTRCYTFHEINTETAYDGGSCLRIKNFNEPLLRCHFKLLPSENLLVSLIVLCEPCDYRCDNFALQVNLRCSDSDDLDIGNDPQSEGWPCQLVTQSSKTNLENNWRSLLFELSVKHPSTLTAFYLTSQEQRGAVEINVGVLEIKKRQSKNALK